MSLYFLVGRASKALREAKQMLADGQLPALPPPAPPQPVAQPEPELPPPAVAPHAGSSSDAMERQPLRSDEANDGTADVDDDAGGDGSEEADVAELELSTTSRTKSYFARGIAAGAASMRSLLGGDPKMRADSASGAGGGKPWGDEDFDAAEMAAVTGGDVWLARDEMMGLTAQAFGGDLSIERTVSSLATKAFSRFGSFQKGPNAQSAARARVVREQLRHAQEGARLPTESDKDEEEESRDESGIATLPTVLPVVSAAPNRPLLQTRSDQAIVGRSDSVRSTGGSLVHAAV
uniref:Uncharacterized protein n=1 Tax=Haptolina ericina TaxID=156174 RepID=A0A7S3AJT9_9EUKA